MHISFLDPLVRVHARLTPAGSNQDWNEGETRHDEQGSVKKSGKEETLIEALKFVHCLSSAHYLFHTRFYPREA